MNIEQQNQPVVSENNAEGTRERPPLTRSAAAALVKVELAIRTSAKSPQPKKPSKKSKSKKKSRKPKKQTASKNSDKSSNKSPSACNRQQTSDSRDCQKNKQKQQRRLWVRYSDPAGNDIPTTGPTFFQGQIDRYYPPSITHQHLAQIDALVGMTTNVNFEPINQSVQAMFRLNAEDLLHTLTPICKQDEEVVSVLVKKPKISAMIFFKKEELMEVEEPKPQQLEDKLSGANFLMFSRAEYIDSEDAMELEKRTIFKKGLNKAVETFRQNNTQQPLNQISEQLLFLNQYLQYKHTQNALALKALRNAMAHQMQNPLRLPNLHDFFNSYTQALLRKNILRGLQDYQIDVLNYYKLRASLQQHKHYIPNRNIEELKDFINKKKVKRNKKTKLPLATSCMGCFNSTNEQFNEIKSCYECGTRAHRICREISNHPCTICESRRTKKIRIRECILCPNRGVLYKKLGSFNLHVFCLLIFNMFRVEDCNVLVDPDEIQIKPNQHVCICCHSNAGIVVKCHETDSYLHPLCAFLTGYFMTMDGRQIIINTQYYNPSELSLARFNRYYRGNLHKYAYRYSSYEDYLQKMAKKQKGHPGSLEDEDDQSGSIEGLDKEILVEEVPSFQSLISPMHNNF